MKTSDMIKGFLTKEDFPEPQLLTIESVTLETIGKEKDEKYVLWVAEHANGIVLGPTTIRQIEQALGSDETDNWTGYKIVAWHDPAVEFGGKAVGGIRFRAPKKGAQVVTPPSKKNARGGKAPAESPPEDDLPF
jgi:hypothetical protein